MKTFIDLTTVNTRIRTAGPDDASFVEAVENDAFLKRMIGGPSGRSAESYRDFFQRNERDLRFLIVECLTTGCPIGVCGLLTGVVSDDCEIRIVLMREHQRRGFGSEIATAMQGLAHDMFPGKTITAKAHPDNEASLAILSRLGFVLEGELRSKSYDNGWLRFRALN